MSHRHHAFSLIELLIVLAILGILAALVVPKYSDATDEAYESTVKRQLQSVRAQIELYRTDHGNPDLIAQQWTPLVTGEYLKQAPENPLNELSVVAGAPAAGVGWVWRDGGHGTFQIYATTDEQTAEYIEQ